MGRVVWWKGGGVPGGEEMSDAEEGQYRQELVGERSVESDGRGWLLGVVSLGCGMGKRF